MTTLARKWTFDGHQLYLSGLFFSSPETFFHDFIVNDIIFLETVVEITHYISITLFKGF